MAGRKFIFPDTNVFEQFQPIENIDWISLADCTEATLLIAPVVIAELNKHKDTAERGRLRNRAAATLKHFHEILDSGVSEIRPKVTVEFCSTEPLIDFGAHRLDPSIGDDRLVAAALHFAMENRLTGADVMVATGDFGMRLKAQSQSSIKALLLPSQLRLPEEIDFETKKIKDLEREITKLRAAIPKVKLAFSDGSSFRKFNVQPSVTLDQSAIDDLTAKVEKKYPLMPERPDIMSLATGTLSLFQPDVPAYNRQLKTYYSQMREFLLSSTEFVNARRRTLTLDLQVTNEGTAPALDVDICLHFPDNFELKRELSRRPQEPSPPDSPEEAVRKKFVLAMPDIGYLNRRIPDFNLPEITNLSLTKLKKTNSYDVEFHVRNLKHTTSEPIEPLYVVFERHESANSFHIDYSVIADNMPTAYEGRLDVIVEKQI